MALELKKLSQADLERAQIPQKHWRASLEAIPDHVGGKPVQYKEDAMRYMAKFQECLREGIGLYLWSEEPYTGKTSLAVVVLKLALRMRATGLFLTADEYRLALMNRTQFDEDYTLEERAREVDVLVLDGLGEEYRAPGSRFAEEGLERFTKSRLERGKLLIVTSRIPPAKLHKFYTEGLQNRFREFLVPIQVCGVKWERKAVDFLKAVDR